MECRMLSLKWDHHSQTFFETLSKIRQKQTYCDATIVCEGNFYRVHKLVMSVCSKYMENLFENVSSQIPQYAHPVIILKDIKRSELEAILEYVYVGEVNVLQRELPALIKAAESLGIKGLAASEISSNKGREGININSDDDILSSWKDNRKLREEDSWENSKTYSSDSYQNRNEDTNHGTSKIYHDIEYETKEYLDKNDGEILNKKVLNAQIKAELDEEIPSEADLNIIAENKPVKEEYDDDSDDIYIEESTSEFASLESLKQDDPLCGIPHRIVTDPRATTSAASSSVMNVNVTGNQYAYHQDFQNTVGMQWADFNCGNDPNTYNMNYKKRKQRTNVSLETKIEIVKKLRDGVKVQDIMNEYNLAKSAVYEWRKDMDRILSHEKNMN